MWRLMFFHLLLKRLTGRSSSTRKLTLGPALLAVSSQVLSKLAKQPDALCCGFSKEKTRQIFPLPAAIPQNPFSIGGNSNDGTSVRTDCRQEATCDFASQAHGSSIGRIFLRPPLYFSFSSV